MSSGYSGGFGSSYHSGGFGSSGYGMGGSMGFNQMGQPNPNQQQGPSNFRMEYQALFNGMFSALSIMYAGVGIINFGGTFLKMGVKVLGFVFRGSWKVISTISGLRILKRLLDILLGRDKPAKLRFKAVLDHVWHSGQKSSRFGKILAFVQIFSLIGAASLVFLKIYHSKRIRSRPAEIKENDEENTRTSENQTKEENKPASETERNEERIEEWEESKEKEKMTPEDQKEPEEPNDKADNLNQQTSEEFWLRGSIENPLPKKDGESNDDGSPSTPIYEFFASKNKNSSSFRNFFQENSSKPFQWFDATNIQNPQEEKNENIERSAVNDMEIKSEDPMTKEHLPTFDDRERNYLSKSASLNIYKPAMWNKKMPWLRKKEAASETQNDCANKT